MAAMTFWFDFYHHFAESVTYGQEGTSFRDFSGCERLPGRPEPINCPVRSTSGIECIIGYHLKLSGVDWDIDWSLELRIQCLKNGTGKVGFWGWDLEIVKKKLTFRNWRVCKLRVS
jgi:hypothetical protein